MRNLMLCQTCYLYRFAINFHLGERIPASLFTGPMVQHEKDCSEKRTSLKLVPTNERFLLLGGRMDPIPTRQLRQG